MKRSQALEGDPANRLSDPSLDCHPLYMAPAALCVDVTSPTGRHLDPKLWYIPKCNHFRVTVPIYVFLSQFEVEFPDQLSQNRTHFKPGKAAKKAGEKSLIIHW